MLKYRPVVNRVLSPARMSVIARLNTAVAISNANMIVHDLNKARVVSTTQAEKPLHNEDVFEFALSDLCA